MSAKTYKYRVHCTHKLWVRKPNPSGWGKFTFDTDNIATWKDRCTKTGVRIDKVERLDQEGAP